MDGLAREGRHVGITTDGRAVLLVWSADRPGMLDDVVDIGPAMEVVAVTSRIGLNDAALREYFTMRMSWLSDRDAQATAEALCLGGRRRGWAPLPEDLQAGG